MSDAHSQTQIGHLIQLINDRDEFVRTRVRQQLIELGEDALPFLEIAEKEENPSLQTRVREIIRVLYLRRLEEKFRRLAASAPLGHMDLEEGMMLIMEFGYPESDPHEVRKTLDSFAGQLKKRISPQDPPRRVVERLTQFLFIEKGFCGNEENYYDPDNCYINKILERNTGLPITLSALSILVAKRLGEPIVGVGLPGHYIAKYDSATDPVYFDPFKRGCIVTREECVELVGRLGYRFEERHILPSTNGETLARMMNNLVNMYSQKQELEKARQMEGLVRTLLKPHEDNPSRPV
ncbi:MAG: transglutaminase-like domain-containing protein [Nitrospinaceae bacterium]